MGKADRQWAVRGAGKPNRLFMKILLFFLSLLIPIIVIGAVEYAYSVHMMKKEFTQRISTNLTSASNTIDSNIETAQVTGVNFLFDEHVQRLLVPRKELSLINQTELWRLPRMIRQHENVLGSFADSIFAYVDDQDVYVSGGLNSFDSFFEQIYSYELYSPEFWKELRDEEKGMQLLPTSQVIQDKSVVKQVAPIALFQRIGNHQAIAVVNLSIDAIHKTLTGNAVFDTTRYLVLDGSGELLFDQLDYEGNVKAELLGLEKLVGHTMTIGQEKVMVVSVKSDLYGWDYYSFTPMKEFQRHTSGILQMTILLCVVLVVTGIIFSFIFSLRIYNPIRNIRDVVLQNNVGDSNSPDETIGEFELIQQGIAKLHDSNKQFEVKSSKRTNDYVEYCLQFLLMGHTLSEEHILRQTLQEDFGFIHERIVCCTIYFDFKEAFYTDIQDTERPLIIQGIKKILWELIAHKMPVYVLEYRPNLFVCVANIRHAEEMAQLEEGYLSMLDIFGYDIRQYYDITVGIGSSYSGINDLRASFNEAMTAMNKRNKEQRFEIIGAEAAVEDQHFLYSLHDEQRILNYLKLGDMAAVHAAVTSVMTSNMERNLSYDQLFLLSKELYGSGIKFLSEKGWHFEAEESEKFRSLHDASANRLFMEPDRLLELAQQFYQRLGELVQDHKGNQNGNLVSLIEQYIQEHYASDLGLEQIADQIGVSDKYVSRLFIEKKDMYITDYINQIRVEKAKELLMHTELKVQEVSEQVGIHSRTTFLRVFRKVEGMTPNEFRQLYRS